MPKTNHIHRYQAKYIGKNGNYKVYACTIDGCTHYIHSNSAPKVLKSICSECGKEINIDSKTLDIEVGKGKEKEFYKPLCRDCKFLKDFQTVPSEVREKL